MQRTFSNRAQLIFTFKIYFYFGIYFLISIEAGVSHLNSADTRAKSFPTERYEGSKEQNYCSSASK